LGDGSAEDCNKAKKLWAEITTLSKPRKRVNAQDALTWWNKYS
jgi:hypothetical protein